MPRSVVWRGPVIATLLLKTNFHVWILIFLLQVYLQIQSVEYSLHLIMHSDNLPLVNYFVMWC